MPSLSLLSVYYTPQPVSASDLALMRRIDELHLNHPFAGARMLRDLLNRQCVSVGRRHADEEGVCCFTVLRCQAGAASQFSDALLSILNPGLIDVPRINN